jgi:hypothetical protein
LSTGDRTPQDPESKRVRISHPSLLAFLVSDRVTIPQSPVSESCTRVWKVVQATWWPASRSVDTTIFLCTIVKVDDVVQRAAWGHNLGIEYWWLASGRITALIQASKIGRCSSRWSPQGTKLAHGSAFRARAPTPSLLTESHIRIFPQFNIRISISGLAIS